MEASTQPRPVMKCNLCAKSFESRKSQLRHNSYCRKARTRITSRRKACTACTKAKTRCEAAHPACSRCLAKNLECTYTSPSSAIKASQVPLENQVRVTRIYELPGSEGSSQNTAEAITIAPLQPSMQLLPRRTGYSFPVQNPAVDVDVAFADSLDSSKWNFGSMDTTAIDIFANEEETTLSESLDYLNKWNFSSNSPELNFLQPTPSDYGRHSADALSTTSLRQSIDASIIEFTNSLNHDQLIPELPRSFVARKFTSRQFSLNRSYVLCTLRSYPNMMLSGRNLPPFIHPNYRIGGDQYNSRKATRDSGQDALEICTAIMRMYSAKTKENTVFIWRTIKMEQERLLAEYSRFSDRDTVAALQAITIYFLLRISEDNMEATNFDIPLIDTMIKLAVNVNGFMLNLSETHKLSWEEWIEAESLRRTIIILFLIDILFDISSVVQTHRCDGSQLLSLGLPSGRDVWRASSRAEWEKEYAAQCQGKKHPTYGDLMRFHWKKEGAFDNWLEHVDEFGTLVMAAASIPHWSDAVYARND